MPVRPCIGCGGLIFRGSYCHICDPRQGVDGKVARLRPAVLARDGYQCTHYAAGVRCATRGTLHIDHILPVSLGGSTEMDNLRTLCSFHNLQKGGRRDGPPIHRRYDE